MDPYAYIQIRTQDRANQCSTGSSNLKHSDLNASQNLNSIQTCLNLQPLHTGLESSHGRKSSPARNSIESGHGLHVCNVSDGILEAIVKPIRRNLSRELDEVEPSERCKESLDAVELSRDVRRARRSRALEKLPNNQPLVL